MKNILIIISLFLLFGCASFTNLEQRITKLEQFQDDAIPLTELAGADARWRDGRTTQGTHNVDEITGMANGDWTIVIEESGATSDFYPYIYDSVSCSPVADGTQRIDGSGGGCWVLARVHFIAAIGEGDDKSINVAQSAEPTSPVTGDCYLDTDTYMWRCYDGDSWREVELTETP